MSLRFLLFTVLIVLSSQVTGNERAVQTPPWKEADPSGTTIPLWFFWSSKCAHCREAHPVIQRINQELPWVRLHSIRVDGHPENIALFQQLAASIGHDANSVPAVIFCGRMFVGWDNNGVVEKNIRDGLSACRIDGSHIGDPRSQALVLPVFGEIDPEEWSLPAFTIAIAALDSFNPCAFFVLLFLLSLLVHAGSRARMLLIGSLFILISGAVYFIAMAAWLNLFTLVGHLPIITLVAGLFAVAISLLNIKDYFFFKQGVSLTMSNKQKGKLIQRTRVLLAAGSIPAMLVATISLAVIANLYELLCTAGFPMVYTRLLTLNGLGATEYYLYLLLYNAVYIVPLMLIMLFFVITLGQRKLQEKEGRILKLLSGLMMFILGLLLIFAPEALNNILIAILLLTGSIVATWVLVKLFPPKKLSG